MERTKTEKKSWEKEELDFLVKNHKKGLQFLSSKLDRSYSSVTGRLFRMGLKSKRSWTKDDEDYLEDNIGRVSIKSIAKQLRRTPAAIYIKMYNMGISVADPYEVTVRRICRKIKMNHGVIYKAIHDGFIKTDGRSKGMHEYHYINPSDVRGYLISNFQFKIFNCFDCGNEVVGDMYCSKHLPNYEPKKPEIPNQFFIDVNWKSEERNRKIGNIVRIVRLSLGLSRKEFGCIVGYTPYWISIIESGKCGRFDLETLSHLFKILNCRVELKVERNIVPNA